MMCRRIRKLMINRPVKLPKIQPRIPTKQKQIMLQLKSQATKINWRKMEMLLLMTKRPNLMMPKRKQPRMQDKTLWPETHKI